MGEWTDAHRTSGNIYTLMSKVSKKQTDQEIKTLYIEFFTHLSAIFWESKLYLFHTYALLNIQYLTKSLKNSSFDIKKEINEKFVLAALQTPLNNKISNFEKFSFQYIPESFKGGENLSPSAKEELQSITKIL